MLSLLREPFQRRLLERLPALAAVPREAGMLHHPEQGQPAPSVNGHWLVEAQSVHLC
jgi:hypothetical protein